MVSPLWPYGMFVARSSMNQLSKLIKSIQQAQRSNPAGSTPQMSLLTTPREQAPSPLGAGSRGVVSRRDFLMGKTMLFQFVSMEDGVRLVVVTLGCEPLVISVIVCGSLEQIVNLRYLAGLEGLG